MNPVPFSWMLIAIGIAFGAGNVNGWHWTHKFYQVEELTRKLASKTLNERRMRVALEMDEVLDEGFEDEERNNQAVLKRLDDKLRARPAAPVDSDPVCVDADIMHELGQLR